MGRGKWGFSFLLTYIKDIFFLRILRSSSDVFREGFRGGKGDFGKKFARVGWGDSGVGAFAVLSAGVNTPHPLNVIKGKKIAFEAGDLAALLHPCHRTDHQRQAGDPCKRRATFREW